MDNRHDIPYGMAGPEHFDPSFVSYENPYQQSYQRPVVHQSHFDGVQFWYRPETQDSVFEHNNLLYNQAIPVPNSPLDHNINQKHRRTRSGCFTCRHRRVKCDETRPICERCKKGNRECQFPQPSSSSRRTDGNDARSTQNKSTSQGAKSDQKLSTIEDEDVDPQDGSVSPTGGSVRYGSTTPHMQAAKIVGLKHKQRTSSIAVEARGESPQSAGSIDPRSRTGTPRSISSTPPTKTYSTATARWKHLDPIIQKYLRYHQEHITRYHYFIKLDPGDFIHNDLIDMALTFEPLLHAVVGFAAYHHALSQRNGQFQDFWKWYSQSIMLLRQWLAKYTDRNEAVLLTILQLATFEEYLGDWAGVASHHRAAYSLFVETYTYENIMNTETSRCIFDWLARGDLAVSLIGGATASLDREWFTTALSWHLEQMDPDDPEITTALPYYVSKLRLIGFDMATVFGSAPSHANTMRAIHSISKRLESLRSEIQSLHNADYLEQTSSSNRSARNKDNTFDQRMPLFQGPLWPLNFLWIDWYGTEQMHKHQTATLMKSIQAKKRPGRSNGQTSPSLQAPSIQDVPSELEKLSLIQCQIFDAIEKSPNAPPGAILGCQASLGLACVFLRKIPKYTAWARQRLAKIESMGYVWPPSFRKQFSQLWNDDDILEWWLPNDEQKTRLLDEIRGVVEERNKDVEGRGGDDQDDVREIKAVFDKLDFGKNGVRARKDSVWSVTGTEFKTNTTKPVLVGGSQSSYSSDDDDEDDDDDDSDEDEEEEPPAPPSMHDIKRSNRDSGFATTAATAAALANTNTNPNPRGQPPLEYSNRMSGIWEGPYNA